MSDHCHRQAFAASLRNAAFLVAVLLAGLAAYDRLITI